MQDMKIEIKCWRKTNRYVVVNKNLNKLIKLLAKCVNKRIDHGIRRG